MSLLWQPLKSFNIFLIEVPFTKEKTTLSIAKVLARIETMYLLVSLEKTKKKIDI